MRIVLKCRDVRIERTRWTSCALIQFVYRDIAVEIRQLRLASGLLSAERT